MNDNEIQKLNNTQGYQDYMLIGSDLVTNYQFSDRAEAGYLPRKIAKQGFRVTHRETWTWEVKPSWLGGGFHLAAYKTNVKIEEVK
jgi:hypothetical protein